MENFIYHLPVKIVFGNGVSKNISEITKVLGSKCFVIADPFYKNDSDFISFYEANKNLFCGLWTGVIANPTIQSVRDAVYAIKKSLPDFVLAVGGGSAIDTAKAACLSAKNDTDINDYHTGKVQVSKDSIPLAAIPTTAGTGSEVTSISVLSNKQTGFKGPVSGDSMLPRIALVDPVWAMTMPPNVTASTGLDALSHAMEAYWSRGSFAVCDIYAEKAVTLIMKNLLKAYQQGINLEARSNMSLASLLAGMAFGQPKNAAVHACSFPLTGKYGLPHGTACAFTLDHFLLHNAKALPDKLNYLADQAGFSSVDQFSQAIHDLKVKMDIPVTLKQAGISEKDIDWLVKASFHPLMNNNPAKVTEENLKEIYNSMKE